MKKAVECGYWHLYRYDPRRIAEGKNPFQLDSPGARYQTSSWTYLMGENRFASLKNNFPGAAPTPSISRGDRRPEGALRHAIVRWLASSKNADALRQSNTAADIPVRSPLSG